MVQRKKAVIFLFDTIADWETPILLTELQKNKNWTVESFSFGCKLVKALSGLTLVPDIEGDLLDASTIDLLILPGGDLWLAPECPFPKLREFTQKVYQSGGQVAAICGATVFLAELGLLNETEHVSNALPFLENFSTDYTGQRFYKPGKLAHHHNKIITGSGIGAVDFAYQVMQSIELMPHAEITKWYELFKYGKYTP